ncbi:MAG: flavin reductase family protein [Acidimicrobiales bacterium]
MSGDTPWTGYHDLVADLDFPMLIVPATSDGERAGCLVGFAAQCSIEPLRFMVWISKKNRTYSVAMHSSVLNVHFPSSADRGLAELFGGQTGDTVDKFSRCLWREGSSGVPVLSDCTRWFAGRVLERTDGGDHMGFMLEPVDGAVGPWAGQLGFQQTMDIEPGHGA